MIQFAHTSLQFHTENKNKNICTFPESSVLDKYVETNQKTNKGLQFHASWTGYMSCVSTHLSYTDFIIEAVGFLSPTGAGEPVCGGGRELERAAAGATGAKLPAEPTETRGGG